MFFFFFLEFLSKSKCLKGCFLFLCNWKVFVSRGAMTMVFWVFSVVVFYGLVFSMTFDWYFHFFRVFLGIGWFCRDF